jgi:hypothetical protein
MADVPPESVPSEFHVEKQRANAVVTLSSGQSMRGSFFVAGGSARHLGPERIGDLLNAETGFFPFKVDEAGGGSAVLFHRNHVVMAALTENESNREPGYGVATRRVISLLLSNGQRVVGTVRVYRPQGRDRLSDWAQHGERFRYIETTEATLIVNIDHVVEAREVTEG